MAKDYQFTDITASGPGMVVAAFDNQVAYCSASGAPISHGASRQHRPLMASCVPATRALPQRWATQPPPAQPITPAPSTQNAAHDNVAPSRRVAKTSGTSTHMV